MDTAASWESRWERADKRRAQAAKRRPPMPTIANGAGTCRWCAGEIRYPEGHKRAGEINTRRGWHPECVGWHAVAVNSADQRRAVRPPEDGQRCALCPNMIGDHRVFSHWRRGLEGVWSGRFTEVTGVWGQPWEADHIVPLWMVRGASLEQRGCFYGLANLWALCSGCHAAKTKREAAARAHARKSP